MKKFLITITSLVLALVVCFSTLAGCGLLTTDAERDMNQVVATVQIDESAPVEKIYKKDMVTAFLNSNYYYQLLGYGSVSYTAILNSLVENRIYVQSAMKIMSEKDEYKNIVTADNKWNVETYLDDEEKLDAEYSTVLSVNNIIESYVVHDHSEHEEKVDALWGEVRTTPSNATNAVKEKTSTEKDTYIKEGLIGLEKEIGEAENRTAYNKVVNALRDNGILGDDYKGDLRDSDYYKQTLKNYQETTLVEKFEKSLRDEVRKSYDFEKLSAAYLEEYNSQANDWNTATFEEKLSSASASSPVLVSKAGTYGFVYNLLLGVDGTVLSTKIGEIDAELSKEEKIKERNKILSAITVKDLRSSWIESGYDFDGTKFTGDYTLVKDAANSLEFKGITTKLRDKNEEEGITAKYRVDSVTEYTLTSFVDMMDAYIYGTEFNSANVTVGANTSATYRKYDSNSVVAEYDAKINELLFAFSTDPGSLNTYKGYVVKPEPEGTGTEEYVEEFANGARELLTMGGTSYIIVATDYGYHVMFFSEVLKADYSFADLISYLNSEYGTKTENEWKAELETIINNWDEEEVIKPYKTQYLYLLLDSISSNAVTNAVNQYKTQTLNTYKYDSEKYVKIFEERFADLTE